ncbi:hypothetical protein H8D29_03595 [PVC group bacterium]|nr:hypothetical protein [PVC group bacterium]
MKPSESKISGILKELSSYYEKYLWGGADASHLKMGFPIAVQLMKFGQDGFLDSEIEMIDGFIERCTEQGILQ